MMYYSNAPSENYKQGLTVRISLCEGQCRSWFSGCGLRSREYHPQWTSSPNLLAGAYHSAAWSNQMHQNNCYIKHREGLYWKWHLGIKLQKKKRTSHQEILTKQYIIYIHACAKRADYNEYVHSSEYSVSALTMDF